MDGIEIRRPMFPILDRYDLVRFIDDTPTHAIRLLANLDADGLTECLALDRSPTRPILLFNAEAERATAEIAEAAVAEVAKALTAIWPFLWDGADFSDLRDDALGRAHLPIRLAALLERLPQVSQSWAVRAVLKLLRGRPPRLADAPLDLEWAQLVLAFSPAGLTLVTELRPLPGIAQIRALEWLAQRADVAVIVLVASEQAADAPDRVLFGARHVPGPARDTVTDDAQRSNASDRPMVLALPDAPEGHPHPMSPVEQKLYRLIQADDELRPLFAFNRTLPDLPWLQARPDLLWDAGRLVVEIDGPDHRAPAKYRADRHRDYQMLCAGYRVLRMTNDDVEVDAAIAVEKIRTVVRLDRKEIR